jgi:hypothetical protein
MRTEEEDDQQQEEEVEDRVAPPLRAVTSFGSPPEHADRLVLPTRQKSNSEEEPPWLADAARRASTEPGLILSLPLHEDESSMEASTVLKDNDTLAAEAGTSFVTPTRERPVDSTEEEPAWLTDAARQATEPRIVHLHSDIESGILAMAGGHVSPSDAARRAMQVSRQAIIEVSGLSAIELSNGLVALSYTCAQSMRTRFVAGVSETRAVLSSVADPPSGETRLQAVRLGIQERWRGVLQVPLAGVYALFALLHLVAAMVLRVVIHTPEAARQLADYLTTKAKGLRVEGSPTPNQSGAAVTTGTGTVQDQVGQQRQHARTVDGLEEV